MPALFFVDVPLLKGARLCGKGADVLFFSELSHCFRIYFR
jgi:hypothetical protein